MHTPKPLCSTFKTRSEEQNRFHNCSQGKFYEKKHFTLFNPIYEWKANCPPSSRMGSKLPGLPGVRYGSCSDRLK
jgi:hypothetical protein